MYLSKMSCMLTNFSGYELIHGFREPGKQGESGNSRQYKKIMEFLVEVRELLPHVLITKIFKLFTISGYFQGLFSSDQPLNAFFHNLISKQESCVSSWVKVSLSLKKKKKGKERKFLYGTVRRSGKVVRSQGIRKLWSHEKSIKSRESQGIWRFGNYGNPEFWLAKYLPRIISRD